jgi:hypothetical protein
VDLERRSDHRDTYHCSHRLVLYRVGQGFSPSKSGRSQRIGGLAEVAQSTASSGSIDNHSSRNNYSYLLGNCDETRTATVFAESGMDLGRAFDMVLALFLGGDNGCFGPGYAAPIPVPAAVRRKLV